MKVKDILVEGYYDVEKDRYGVALIDDTSRPRFTLEHLNKLRKVREFRKFEKINRRSLLAQIYAPPPAEGEMGGL